MADVRQTDSGRVDEGALYAVMAHGLLSSVALIQGAVKMMGEGSLDAEKEARMLAIIDEQSQYLAEALRDIVRGLPPEVVRQLNAIARVPAVGS